MSVPLAAGNSSYDSVPVALLRNGESPNDVKVTGNIGLGVAVDRRERAGQLACALPGFLDAIRDVVVIASSSRSGSSVFTEILRHSRRLLHLPGEMNPFMRLAGLCWPQSGSGSDHLGPEHAVASTIQALESYLSTEAGELLPLGPNEAPGDEFAWRLYWRLTLQWPLEPITPEDVSVWSEAALEDVRGLRGGSCDWNEDLQLFHAMFLRRVRARHNVVNPYYYDLDKTIIEATFEDLKPPSGAPGPLVIEEPPFVLIRPWRRPEDWFSRPLVIKTPSNVYRLEFLRALFPHARFHVLHLTRNPAASINGIYEGWRHWGFHSHYVGCQLRLRDYPGDEHADRGWWKFDLPPDWDEYTGRPLNEVCAFQWWSAHEAILQFVRDTDVDYRRVKFESIVGGEETRVRTFTDVHEWCVGTADAAFLAAAARSFRPVMAVTAPRPNRWRRNQNILEPVLRDKRIRALAAELGYADEADWL